MESDNFISLGNVPLRDSDIEKINIYKEGCILCINITFKLMSKATIYLKLKCIDVVKYAFLWDSTHFFYNVSHYKLIKENNLFYLSLDPYDEKGSISEYDNDILVCKQMIVCISRHYNFEEYKEFTIIA